MIVRFRKPKTLDEIMRTTKIVSIWRKGDEIEIEFDGTPTPKELREMAELLGLPIIEPIQNFKESRLWRKKKRIQEIRQQMKRPPRASRGSISATR